ncbi:DNA-binding transcriptional regulator, MarR family [Saccharopolyspora antimicrobica]|uniref:DNA-binding MarR family transcriptional regulator n=1 Tax=Saccharopolyspora antimicrobica TaxID=455193 RepID=A0A1I5JWS0_9PSEU|nr:MarR family transcriptional regulator [Saccharopolyspora antimicrobica]RKT86980.1 DNA-binding MarR family transcriptional regulator [Saccharopolyspora antimicrobica]SFO77252.1 DNA-binding transcriptional regulator, MarR family [Saccharopolyspora antimicrobica]
MAQTRPQLLADDIGFLLSRAGGMVLGAVNKALVPLGLKVRSYSVLVLACEHEQGVNQRGVAATMGLDPSQIVGLIDELEDRGLVARTPDPADRRNRLIAATDEGRRVRDEAQALVDQAHSGYFEGLSAKAVVELRETLKRIVFP